MYGDIHDEQIRSTPASSWTIYLTSEYTDAGLTLFSVQRKDLGALEDYVDEDDLESAVIPTEVSFGEGIWEVFMEEGGCLFAEEFERDNQEPTLQVTEENNLTVEEIRQWLKEQGWKKELAEKIRSEFESPTSVVLSHHELFNMVSSWTERLHCWKTEEGTLFLGAEKQSVDMPMELWTSAEIKTPDEFEAALADVELFEPDISYDLLRRLDKNLADTLLE